MLKRFYVCMAVVKVQRGMAKVRALPSPSAPPCATKNCIESKRMFT